MALNTCVPRLPRDEFEIANASCAAIKSVQSVSVLKFGTLISNTWRTLLLAYITSRLPLATHDGETSLVLTGGNAVALASVAIKTTDTANIINKFLIFNTPKF